MIIQFGSVEMHLNCTLRGPDGRSCSGSRMNRGKEMVRRMGMGQRKRKAVYLLFLFVVSGMIMGLFAGFSFKKVFMVENTDPCKPCEESAHLWVEHLNVSKIELHALASFFSESKQAASIQCTKETGPEEALVNGFACFLKVEFSKFPNIVNQYTILKEVASWKDQCPARNSSILWTDSSLFSVDEETLDFSALSLQSAFNQHFQQESSEMNPQGSQPNYFCWTLSSCLVLECRWVVVGIAASFIVLAISWMSPRGQGLKAISLVLLQHWQQNHLRNSTRSAGNWQRKLLVAFVLSGKLTSGWLLWHLNEKANLRREETLANMCDERASMLQDQFNVSMNHVHALAILVSTFHHGKHPSAIDQKTFGEYTERTAFDRPLTSGVAYAVKVPHSAREEFEKHHGWRIKKMETEDQSLVKDNIPEKLDPAPVQDEYAPVVFAQETVSHIISVDMMSGKEDRENILRARASGKAVLTSPFKLLKSNHLGVVLTFSVYDVDLSPDSTPEQRIEATVGYLGASYDVPSLVEKLLHQLAGKQMISVNVYDTTNGSEPITMYGTGVIDTGLVHISNLDFGDPLRKHEMHCRFKQKPPFPWTPVSASFAVLVITLLVGHIFHAAINRIAKVEEDCHAMMELKIRAEAADVAKSQFLATVSHEIRTPMNGVLGMLQMLMDTELDPNQQDYAKTAHDSGNNLIWLINQVLDQAKIESGRLELEKVPFDLCSVLDNVLSLFSGRSNEKQAESGIKTKEIEMAVYVSDKVPQVVTGDPGRFQQIVTNLMGNAIKFTNDKGHVFVTVHLADEVQNRTNVKDPVLRHSLNMVEDTSDATSNTLSGFRVVDRWKSWEKFEKLNDTSEPESVWVLVTVEDTGVGIPLSAQNRIFTPFMQVDSSTSRTYGGTGIGLSISKCLVDLMHGEIGFVSECGIGSTFSFAVPFGKYQMHPEDSKRQSYEPNVVEFKGIKALVIDRRSTRAEVTRCHLQRLGVLVDVVPSLQSAKTYISPSCGSREFCSYAMVLIDKDDWERECFLGLVSLFLNNGDDSRIKVSFRPKVFLLATTIDNHELPELKSIGFIDNVLIKPLRLSVLASCFQEALGHGQKKFADRKKVSNPGTLLKEKRILVVDDNLINRRVAEGALKKYGAIVTCVGSGKDALRLLHPPHDFDACFMDLRMPEMDGFEATRRVRQLEEEINSKIKSGEASAETFGNVVLWHVPMLAMTADVIQATNEECLKCGMDGYVSKPFEEQQLYSAVAQFFDATGKGSNPQFAVLWNVADIVLLLPRDLTRFGGLVILRLNKKFGGWWGEGIHMGRTSCVMNKQAGES
ncbi:hypothetical protein MLD38_009076 [Melastoma candidum]|uniref:Uncharacterized protein n=1 Tax=Melastoma candidum TaxID=119954 RepID=A0ACB9RWY0_9MYRT|nr:hypothetical protein MLD38_009076 [Melastoma candidum]